MTTKRKSRLKRHHSSLPSSILPLSSVTTIDEICEPSLNNLSIIPYQSYERSIYLQNINNYKQLGEYIVREFESTEYQYPIMTFDHCKLFDHHSARTPSLDSKWYNHKQQWMSNSIKQTNKYMTCNSPSFINSNCQQIQFKKWYTYNYEQNNIYLNKLQRLSNELKFKLHSLKRTEEVSTQSVITKETILNVCKYNLQYIKSLKKPAQSWISDTNFGYGFNHNNHLKSRFNLQYLSQRFGLAEEIWQRNKLQINNTSFIQCSEPGYVQCMKRNPMDMWSIHLQLSGTQLLFSTSQLNEACSVHLQSTLSHGPGCPMCVISQQNIFPNIHHLHNSLPDCPNCNGMTKLYATICFPGTLTIIKGGTITFGLSISKNYNWFQSTLFAPNDKDTINQCHQYFKNCNDYINENCKKKKKKRSTPETSPDEQLQCNSTFSQCSDPVETTKNDYIFHQIKDDDTLNFLNYQHKKNRKKKKKSKFTPSPKVCNSS